LRCCSTRPRRSTSNLGVGVQSRHDESGRVAVGEPVRPTAKRRPGRPQVTRPATRRSADEDCGVGDEPEAGSVLNPLSTLGTSAAVVTVLVVDDVAELRAVLRQRPRRPSCASRAAAPPSDRRWPSPPGDERSARASRCASCSSNGSPATPPRCPSPTTCSISTAPPSVWRRSDHPPAATAPPGPPALPPAGRSRRHRPAGPRAASVPLGVPHRGGPPRPTPHRPHPLTPSGRWWAGRARATRRREDRVGGASLDAGSV